MKLTTNPKAKEVFDQYPDVVRDKMKYIRALVLEVASQIDGLDSLEETLKWNEPSFLTKHGSTLRMDWKAKKPDQYALYFSCSSQLVPTFRVVYNNTLKFVGNRAIVLKLDQKIPEDALRHCIELALTYHSVKHLPLLGA